MASSSMTGMLGPRMSASTSPIWPPNCCSANARLTLTVDLPTPPFPLATAMRCPIPGSRSGPADGADAAPGAVLLGSSSVVCHHEPMLQPAEPAGVDVDVIVRGTHQVVRAAREAPWARVELLGSGVSVP